MQQGEGSDAVGAWFAGKAWRSPAEWGGLVLGGSGSVGKQDGWDGEDGPSN